MEIFIKGNVPSSKNGRVWTGRFLVESPRVKKYRQETKDDFLRNKEVFLSMLEGKEKPYLIGFHFVRNNRHKFDFCNMLQLPQDLFVEYGFLDDDNCDEMLPIPYIKDGVYYNVDKNKPGVWVKIL